MLDAVPHLYGMLFWHIVFTHCSNILSFLQPFSISDNFFVRAFWYPDTICASNLSAFLIALSRAAVSVFFMSDMWLPQSDASSIMLHSAKYLSKSESDSHARQSDVQRWAVIMHDVIAVSHWSDVCSFFNSDINLSSGIKYNCDDVSRCRNVKLCLLYNIIK